VFQSDTIDLIQQSAVLISSSFAALMALERLNDHRAIFSACAMVGFALNFLSEIFVPTPTVFFGSCTAITIACL
jgi:hypothetical protein